MFTTLKGLQQTEHGRGASAECCNPFKVVNLLRDVTQGSRADAATAGLSDATPLVLTDPDDEMVLELAVACAASVGGERRVAGERR